jgi:uncharacterized protein YjiS (DUF1127 family)
MQKHAFYFGIARVIYQPSKWSRDNAVCPVALAERRTVMSAYQMKAHPAYAGYEDQREQGFSNHIRRSLVKFSDWVKARRAYHRAVAELESMSDRDLADIGIVRCDIPAILRGEARPGYGRN